MRMQPRTGSGPSAVRRLLISTLTSTILRSNTQKIDKWTEAPHRGTTLHIQRLHPMPSIAKPERLDVFGRNRERALSVAAPRHARGGGLRRSLATTLVVELGEKRRLTGRVLHVRTHHSFAAASVPRLRRSRFPYHSLPLSKVVENKRSRLTGPPLSPTSPIPSHRIASEHVHHLVLSAMEWT